MQRRRGEVGRPCQAVNWGCSEPAESSTLLVPRGQLQPFTVVICKVQPRSLTHQWNNRALLLNNWL